MKYFVLLSIFVVVISCSKSGEPSSLTAQTLEASALGVEDTNTKISFEQDSQTLGRLNISWQEGDEISVANASSLFFESVFRVSRVDDVTGRALFVKVSGEDLRDDGTLYIAVYPKTDLTTVSSWRIADFDTQTQSYDAAIDHLAENTMMQTMEFVLGQRLSFEHLCAVLTINFNVADVAALTAVELVDGNVNYPITLNGLKAGQKTYQANMMIRQSRYAQREVVVNNGDITLFSKPTTTLFSAGRHYTIDISSSLKLSNINKNSVPQGDTWEIGDSEASSADFSNLEDALRTIEKGRTINLIFPNLKSLPYEAFARLQTECSWTLTANSVTTLEQGVFHMSSGVSSISLASATELKGSYMFAEANSLTHLTIASHARVTEASPSLFSVAPLSQITLTTHPSNINGKYFLLPDGTNVGPFDMLISSVN